MKWIPVVNVATAVWMGSTIGGCLHSSATQHGRGPETRDSAQQWTAVGEDSLVSLRADVPSDSVYLFRGGAKIFLALGDLDEYFESVRGSAEMDTLQLAIQREFASRGSVWLGDDEIIDMVAARLLAAGKASVRDNETGRLASRVRIVRERRFMSGGAVDHLSFFAPDDRLILRVLDSITVS